MIRSFIRLWVWPFPQKLLKDIAVRAYVKKKMAKNQVTMTYFGFYPFSQRTSFQVAVQFYLTFRKIAKFCFLQSLQKNCKKAAYILFCSLLFLSDQRYILQKYNNERIHFFLYHTNCKIYRHHCKCSNWVAKYCNCQQILHGRNS